jgi:hypothetical protein
MVYNKQNYIVLVVFERIRYGSTFENIYMKDLKITCRRQLHTKKDT